jgi:hypothetical protein
MRVLGGAKPAPRAPSPPRPARPGGAPAGGRCQGRRGLPALGLRQLLPAAGLPPGCYARRLPPRVLAPPRPPLVHTCARRGCPAPASACSCAPPAVCTLMLAGRCRLPRSLPRRFDLKQHVPPSLNPRCPALPPPLPSIRACPASRPPSPVPAMLLSQTAARLLVSPSLSEGCPQTIPGAPARPAGTRRPTPPRIRAARPRGGSRGPAPCRRQRAPAAPGPRARATAASTRPGPCPPRLPNPSRH